MAEISLDDIGREVKKATPKPKKKKRTDLKPKSTSKPAVKKVKPAVKAKTVSKGKKIVRKKKKSKTAESTQDMSRPKSLPANTKPSDQLEVLDQQMGELVDSIPDIVKQENEQIQEYMMMFSTCRELARTAEEIYFEKKQSRDLYPIMQTYNQMREIIADLRALRDVGQMGEVLNEEVISPLMQANGSALVNMRQQLSTWFKSNLPPDVIANANEALDTAMKKAAHEMQNSYQDSLNKTIQVFNGGM